MEEPDLHTTKYQLDDIMPSSGQTLETLAYNETKFVGRKKYINKLDAAWDKHCVFGTFGLRSVGKSRLITKYLRNKVEMANQPSERNDNAKPLVLYEFDLRMQTDVNSLYSNLCARFNVVPEPEATLTDHWIHHVTRTLNRSRVHANSTVVLFFDNAENVIESQAADPFLSLIVALINRCPNVKTFLTSTTKIQFSQHGRVVFTCDLPPLTETESLELLMSIAPRVELKEYKKAIIKLSEGLPLLILMIGAELNDVTSHMTPGKMVETLSKCRLQTCTERDYSSGDLTEDVGEIYRNFILRLSKVYQERLKTLEFIPGSFNASESMEMLGYNTVAMVKGDVLVHLHRRFMITYDRSRQRFDIQGILRESLQMYFTLSNITEVRSSYCRTFARVIQNISDRMSTEDCSRALKEFAIEQANLRKFLQEVLFTKEDTYPFFLEVASSCALLIENFMEGESEIFYNGCLRAAEEYGRPQDKAIINVSIGSLYTNIKEDLPRGAEVLRSAIERFLNDPQTRKIHLATAYQRLGWNLHKQGKNAEAVKTLQKSYAISSHLDKEALLLRVQNMNSLGLANDMLGNFQEAKRYHFGSLTIRRAFLGKEHPFTGATINNIGMFFKKQGEFREALTYLREGLRIKRLNKTTVISLVDSLGNVAEECISEKRFAEAESLLDEAMKLLNAQKVPSKEGLALTYNARGLLFEAQGDYAESVKWYTEAARIRRDAFPEDIVHFDSLVLKANAEFNLGDYSAATASTMEALRMKDTILLAMPYTPNLVKCFDCVANLHKARGNMTEYVRTVGQIESELLRLERIHAEYGNEKQMNEINERLRDIREELNRFSGVKPFPIHDEPPPDELYNRSRCSS